MLFDLQGKRRRLVQVVYLMLAIFLGGGLVLFGVGSDAQGGLLDGCSGAGTSADGDPAIAERLDDATARLRANPEDEVALTDTVRANYQLATAAADPATGAFDEEGLARLRAASDAWERYLDLDPATPDDSLAGLMVQAYAPTALNDPAAGAGAAEIVAQARPSSNAFLQLAEYATLAGQTRKADLAGDRAIDLAPNANRKAVEKQVDELAAAQAQAEAGAAPAGGPGQVEPPSGQGQAAPPTGQGAPAPGGPAPDGAGGGSRPQDDPPGGGRP